MQSNELPVSYVIFLFIPFGVLLWIAVSSILAELSGWRLLLRYFRDDGSAREGKKFSFVSAEMRRWSWFPVRYKNCLSMKVGPDGFSVAIFLLLRFRSPSLFIPFFAIESLEVLPGKFLGATTSLKLKPSGAILNIYGVAGEAIAKAFARFQKQTSL